MWSEERGCQYMRRQWDNIGNSCDTEASARAMYRDTALAEEKAGGRGGVQ